MPKSRTQPPRTQPISSASTTYVPRQQSRLRFDHAEYRVLHRTFTSLYISQGDDAAPQSVRVELSSEADLFFHYTHSIDDASFQVRSVLHPWPT